MLKKIKYNLNRKLMSASVKRVLEEEELSGAIIANKFRYLFLILIASAGFLNLAGIQDLDLRFKGFKIYSVGLFIYLAITVIHSFLLKNGNKKRIHIFGFITILSDFYILTSMMYSWYKLDSPDNFNYFLKNPTFLYYTFPFMLALIQIKLSYSAIGIFTFLCIHFSSIIYGSVLGVSLAPNWKTYLLGDAVFMQDLLVARPLVYSCLALTVGYSIYRTIYMVRRIGTIEAE